MKRVQQRGKNCPSFLSISLIKRGVGEAGNVWKRGFTLIELLLAIALFCVVAVAIYSSLAIGIKVHTRGGQIGGECSDLDIAFYRIAQDLRTAVHINNIYLVKESQNLYFYSVQPTPGGTRQLYKITYTWEKEKDYYTLLRVKETYVDSVQEEHPKGDRLLDGIKNLGFDFGYIKKGIRGEEELQWRDKWEDEAMPKLVRLKVEVDKRKFCKIIYCPAGKMGEVKEK